MDTLYVDLAAAIALSAEKDNQKIAVEVKSFVGKSETADLQQALGQYFLYRWLMDRQDPDRVLFLAVPETIYRQLFEGVKGEILLSNGKLKVFGYSTEKEEIIGWKI